MAYRVQLTTIKKKLFSNASFTINSGDMVSIIGPSGAGKSTLLMLMVGVVKPDTGTVSWLDKQDCNLNLMILSQKLVF